MRDLVYENKKDLTNLVDTKFADCQSKINEFSSYLEDLHKEMTRFMMKKKTENQANFLDLQHTMATVKELSKALYDDQRRTNDNFALLLTCLVEVNRL